MRLYHKKISLDILLITVFWGILLLEYLLFCGIFRIETILITPLLGVTSYFCYKFRKFVVEYSDLMIDLKLKNYFKYETKNQVISDLMRNKLIYFEFIDKNILIQGKAFLNSENYLEISIKNDKIHIIDDPDYTFTINSLVQELMYNNALIVRGEKYMESLKENKCTGMIF